MTLCFIGIEGGRTTYGNIRPVFYSDTAAPLIMSLMEGGGEPLLGVLRALKGDPEVKQQMDSCKNVATRHEILLRLAGRAPA